ncbi:MAG: LysM peptidoglycan-binding domain-containing protein, partial [Hymenobacteraceae bacterium]|nr:LysM peptidoglycan-binding domain-containing protein [Hymenobacteraceae bacterium]
MKAIVKYVLAIVAFCVFFAFNEAGAIPIASAFSIPDRSVATDSVYLVQQGDTYYSLSRRFNIPLDSLQKWNGTQLNMGQTLYLTNRKTQAKTIVAKSTASPSTASKPTAASPKAATPTPATAKPTAQPAQTTSTPTAKPATAAKSATAMGTGPARTQESTSASASTLPTLESKVKQRILVVPFDPYLYFSDADDEIARHSKIPRQNVRHVFRGRLNAMLAPEGYET